MAKKLYEHFSFDNFAILVSHLSVCIFDLFICLLNDLKINRNNNLGHFKIPVRIQSRIHFTSSYEHVHTSINTTFSVGECRNSGPITLFRPKF